MNDEKRGLSRGLDDLMAQNEIDLPFLSTYGPASDVEDEISQAKSPPEEIFDAVLRHLRSLNQTFDYSQKREIQISGLVVKIEDNGVSLTFNHLIRLPFVPSDLASPGLTEGNLSDDGLSGNVKIQAWGIEARRCLSRFVEHSKINDVE
jgi:hypothetical protein|tara:strand:- start:53 stop:499 length:447 start_codon:yes stop_codon:yes gene_type:complete